MRFCKTIGQGNQSVRGRVEVIERGWGLPGSLVHEGKAAIETKPAKLGTSTHDLMSTSDHCYQQAKLTESKRLEHEGS